VQTPDSECPVTAFDTGGTAMNNTKIPAKANGFCGRRQITCITDQAVRHEPFRCRSRILLQLSNAAPRIWADTARADGILALGLPADRSCRTGRVGSNVLFAVIQTSSASPAFHGGFQPRHFFVIGGAWSHLHPPTSPATHPSFTFPDRPCIQRRSPRTLRDAY